LRGFGQVDLDVPGAEELARLAPRQRHNVASTGRAEVPQCGISHQSGRARDHHFLPCHALLRRQLPAFSIRRRLAA
jgi:hypothetical protein